MRNIIISIIFLIYAIVPIFSGYGTGISKREVVNAALKSGISSFDCHAKIETSMNLNGQVAKTSMDVNMKYIKEPFKTHLKMGTEAGSIEMYMDKDNVYMQMPGESNWIKTQINAIPGLNKIASGESIKEGLDRLNSYEGLFKLERKDNDYILKIRLTKDSDKKGIGLVKDILKNSLQNNLPINNFALKINTFNLTLTLDKNYLMKSSKTAVDIELQNKTNKTDITRIVAKDDESYSNVNKVKNFDIPSDVVNNAQGQ